MSLKPFHLLFYNKPTIIRLYFFCFVAYIVVLFDISTLGKKTESRNMNLKKQVHSKKETGNEETIRIFSFQHLELVASQIGNSNE